MTPEGHRKGFPFKAGNMTLASSFLTVGPLGNTLPPVPASAFPLEEEAHIVPAGTAVRTDRQPTQTSASMNSAPGAVYFVVIELSGARTSDPQAGTHELILPAFLLLPAGRTWKQDSRLTPAQNLLCDAGAAMASLSWLELALFNEVLSCFLCKSPRFKRSLAT